VSVIGAILPGTVVALDAFGDGDADGLVPEEEAALGRAVDSRRREFATGRSLARRALASLGVPHVAIPRGADREPIWPPAIAGSITHCAGYCAAAVARRDAIATLGIDAEIHDALPTGVIRIVARDEEREWIDARRGDGLHWDRVLFSAKESVFKAWFPIARRWLGFADASVRFDPDRDAFCARLVTERVAIGGRETTCFDGRYLVDRGYVWTAVAIDTTGGTYA
jgi:4'-phosphopantetheinyl transferase EntD